MSLFKYEQNMFCAKCKSLGNTTRFRHQVLCGTGRPGISLHVLSLHFSRLVVADTSLCQAISQAKVASMKHQQPLGSVVDILCSRFTRKRHDVWCRCSSMNKTCFVRRAKALATPLALDIKFCVVLLADPECSHIPRLYRCCRHFSLPSYLVVWSCIHEAWVCSEKLRLFVDVAKDLGTKNHVSLNTDRDNGDIPRALDCMSRESRGWTILPNSQWSNEATEGTNTWKWRNFGWRLWYWNLYRHLQPT